MIDGAPLDRPVERGTLGCGQFSVEKRIEPVERQVQRREHEKDGFVVGIVGSVPVAETRRLEPAHRIAQPVADGLELGRERIHRDDADAPPSNCRSRFS